MHIRHKVFRSLKLSFIRTNTKTNAESHVRGSSNGVGNLLYEYSMRTTLSRQEYVLFVNASVVAVYGHGLRSEKCFGMAGPSKICPTTKKKTRMQFYSTLGASILV